jgi:hypothetical protein
MEVKPGDDLHQSILEHLNKHGYAKAAKALKEEIKTGKKKAKSNPKKRIDEMIKSFDNGDQTKFISQWNEYVVKNHTSDLYAHKIEFYVRIYFTIYPMHSLNKASHSEKIVQLRQKEFKKFLDTKGSELSKTSEFLPYYALPYVPNPTDHPSFKQLFTTEWIKNLKDKLHQFLSDTITTNDETRLAKIYNAGLNRDKADDFNFEDDGLNEEMVEQINMLQHR